MGDEAGQISVINEEGTIQGISLEANGNLVENGVEGTTDNQIDAAGNVTSSATIQGKVHGVLATGASTRIENHGAIIGGTGAGVDLGGNSSMLENSGWIIGQTNGLAALKGGSKSVTNSGRIVGKAGNGIQFNGENSSLTNSGTIEGMDVAILVTDSGASNNLSIVNSGLLKTANSNNGSQYFIRDLGSNNITLTLNPGTRFEYGTETEPALALLDLGGGSNTVNIETGLSTVLLLTVGERTDENGNALADSTLPEINAASGIVVTENLSDSGLRVCAGQGCSTLIT